MTASAGMSRIDVRGEVYFVQSGDRPFVKIGWTVDPQRRLLDLQCANPDELVLLASVPGTVEDERGWHKRFKHLSVRNEWFELNDELRDAIRNRRAVAREILIDRHGDAPGPMDRHQSIARLLQFSEREARKDAAPRGSASGTARLDEAKVVAILSDKRSVRAIAKEYGVGAMTIHAIQARKTWRHVEDPQPEGKSA